MCCFYFDSLDSLDPTPSFLLHHLSIYLKHSYECNTCSSHFMQTDSTTSHFILLITLAIITSAYCALYCDDRMQLLN